MSDKDLSESNKWAISLWSAVLFLAVAYSGTFKLTNSLFETIGLRTITDNGCPTLVGLCLHAVVFALLIRLSMLLPFPSE